MTDSDAAKEFLAGLVLAYLSAVQRDDAKAWRAARSKLRELAPLYPREWAALPIDERTRQECVPGMTRAA